MSSVDRRASLSPGEQQRTKSQSSSRSRRTPPDIVVHDDDERREKSSSTGSKRSTRETVRTKRSGSSASNRSGASPSNGTKRRTSNIKTPTATSPKSKSPSAARKSTSKRKKSSVSASDAENKFNQPNDAERQDLNSRGLTIVPAEIFEMITLRRLILSNNNLSGLPPSIRNLINLEYLDLSRNPLRVKNGLDDYSGLPREFHLLRNLQVLIMAECTLKHIPAVVWQTLSIQTLDISRNKVGFVVGDIGNLTDIRHLRLSQMDLDTLPPEIGFCDKLQSIDLTGNPIDNLPETLVECRQLSELKINFKTFHKLLDSYMLALLEDGKIRSEHLPQVIFELENLQSLDLNGTKLNSISNEHTLHHLTELSLAKNFFHEIPESLCSMTNLKLLDMTHNRIRSIPDYLIRMKSLEILNLSHNHLTVLPAFLAHLITLKKLIVNHNKLIHIEDDLAKSRSLIALDLSYNQLKSISDRLCDLEQLETFDLRYNHLEILPLSIRRMIGLKTMNTFDAHFQRIGLHLIGNAIIDPPSFVWKSTDIQTLFAYMETKQKYLSNNYFHLKLIFIGPKNVGKTTLVRRLIADRRTVSKTRQTIDAFIPCPSDADNEQNQSQSSDINSSALTDQWIENRISTGGDHLVNQTKKIRRMFPPALKTYGTTEATSVLLHKSTLITKNNLYCSIFDLTSEPCFEIVYPLIYDANALFVLPINLTTLWNILQAASSLQMNEDENELIAIDFDALLTSEWLQCHIFRYIESIADYCQRASIAVVGLLNVSQLPADDRYQQQQLLAAIQTKVTEFLSETTGRRAHIQLYSEFFPEPIRLDDEQMASLVIEQLETIAHQWNLVHHKRKCQILKRRLGFVRQDALTIDYPTCLQHFEQERQSPSSSDDDDEHRITDDDEFNQMTFDACLDYLTLTGDILCFGETDHMTIIIKPCYLLNKILAQTIFRPNIDRWLKFDDNMIFHFSGYYLTQQAFDIDRQRILGRGEFTWKMLNILFTEQSSDANRTMNEKMIIDYCRLMQRLYLGYVNESNTKFREFTQLYFVCPWLNKDISSEIYDEHYFKRLDQHRYYENLQIERARRIKQQQLWFALDEEQEHFQNENESEANVVNLSDEQQHQHHARISIPDVPPIDELSISNAEESLQTITILNRTFDSLPDGLYERLLICLHPYFHERLDFHNLTLARTNEKYTIRIERFNDDPRINLTINKSLLENVQQTLIDNLFSFYPTVDLQIET